MARLGEKLTRRVLGGTDVGRAGLARSFRGLREGDRRELAIGLVLTAIAYMRRTRSEKTLVYRQEIKEGRGVLVRNAKPGQPRAEVTNPVR